MKLLAALALVLAPALAGDSVSEGVLRRNGIEPTASSIAAWLQTQCADPGEARVIARFVEDLSSTHPKQRAAALTGLEVEGVRAIPALKAATRSADPEVRRLVAPLLARLESKVPFELLHACYRLVHDLRLPGLTPEILATLPLGDEPFLRRAGRFALRATSGPKDVPFLREAIEKGTRDIHYAAVVTLADLLGADSVPTMRDLIEREGHDRVVLGAAVALADHGDRLCLPALGRLLDSRDPWNRQRAVQALREIRGERFGYFPHDGDERRRASTQAWLAWIEDHATEATWQTPLRRPPMLLGRTLIALYSEGKVIELNARGDVIWELKVRHPWACIGLPNGHRLICLYLKKSVVEYDAEGNECWRRDGLPGLPTSVQRLSNGNTLVACGEKDDMVVEIARDRSIVWQAKLAGRPSDAKRLRNGNTLVTLTEGNHIAEIDPAGTVVWKLPGALDKPYSTQVLNNGNLLVSEMPGRVVELDRQGDVVWSLANLKWSYCAQRLSNGRTLVCDRKGIRELDPDGQLVSHEKLTGYLWAHRY